MLKLSIEIFYTQKLTHKVTLLRILPLFLKVQAKIKIVIGKFIVPLPTCPTLSDKISLRSSPLLHWKTEYGQIPPNSRGQKSSPNVLPSVFVDWKTLKILHRVYMYHVYKYNHCFSWILIYITKKDANEILCYLNNTSMKWH